VNTRVFGTLGITEPYEGCTLPYNMGYTKSGLSGTASSVYLSTAV